MKTCEKCGKEIVNGVNGCMMLAVCFPCNGGFPDYSRNKSNIHFQDISFDDLDGIENRCLHDC